MRKLLKISCLLALLVAPWAASAAGNLPSGPCRMIDPTTCSTANQLARASGFAQAVGHFTGEQKVGYFKANRTVAEQVLAALGGEPDSVVTLADKRYLFSACPPHDCKGNAAAVVLNEYGQIEAVGISSFHCDTSCEDVRHLDFFMKKDDQDDTVLAALKTWGTSDTIHKVLWHAESDDGIDGRTQVHLIP